MNANLWGRLVFTVEADGKAMQLICSPLNALLLLTRCFVSSSRLPLHHNFHVLMDTMSGACTN